MDDEFVVETQHDRRAEFRPACADQDRPGLEELGGRTLDHRVPTEPTTGGGPVAAVAIRVLAVAGRHGDASSAERAQVGAALRRRVGVSQVSHRHRVLALEPGQGLGAAPGGRSVHRTEHGELRECAIGAELSGHTLVHVVVVGGVGERVVPRDRGEHAWFDLPEVGAHEHVALLGDDGGTELSRHVVQARRRRHPARRSVRPRPVAAQTTVGAEVLVDPEVAERGADALGPTPREERGDDGMPVDHPLESPRSCVGHLDAGAAQERPDRVRAAQVDAVGDGEVGEHLGVALGQTPHLVLDRERPRADEARDDPLGGGPVHREAVTFEFGAEDLRRRLRHRRAPSAVRSGEGPDVLGGFAPEGGVLSTLALDGELGPGDHPGGRIAPRPLRPVVAEVAVGADRFVRIAVVVLLVEEVDRGAVGEPGRVESVDGGPHVGRLAAPAAVDETVDGGQVPALRRADAELEEPSGRLLRPPDPARSDAFDEPVENLAHVVGRHEPRRSVDGRPGGAERRVDREPDERSGSEVVERLAHRPILAAARRSGPVTGIDVVDDRSRSGRVRPMTGHATAHQSSLDADGRRRPTPRRRGPALVRARSDLLA